MLQSVRATVRGFPEGMPVWTVIGARPQSRREGEFVMMLWDDMNGTWASPASGVSVSELNACITRRTSFETDSTVPFDQGAYTVEKRCFSKRRRESLHDLVADVRALNGEPLQNRNEGGEILFQERWPWFLHPLSWKVAKRRSLRNRP